MGKRLIFAWACLLLSVVALSQTDDSVLDGVVHTWKRYAERHRPPGLFLHLDKSVYEHTEHIQFTAWLLDGQRDTSHLHSLYVLLVDPALRKLVAFDRFVLSRYAGVGALYLADTLHPGKYLVVAYTDDRLQGWDQPAFRQEITLLPDQPPPFSLVLQRDTARLKFRVPTDYGGLAAGGNFRYRLQVDGRTIDSGEKKIDAFGEVTLPQPALPTATAAVGTAPGSTGGSAAPGPILLTAMVKRQDQTAYFWQPVVTAPVEWHVHYYPEGGDLVADRPSQIGIEIRDAAGSPISVLGRLLEDGQPVVAFKTDSNGLGLLVKEFKSGRSYTVDFPDKPAGVRISGDLPAVQPEGYSLMVSDGVARDSVEVLLYLPAPGMKCRLLIYNERELVYASTLLARKEAARITIPVKDWPTGMLTMTLFDSQGLPVAERRLYCPSPDLSVTIRPDFPVATTMPPDQEKADPAFAHAKTLQKVTVTPGGKSLAGCRDYVCMMGILNCQNHPYGRKPVPGEIVLVADGFNQFRRVVYSGCEVTEGVYPLYVRRVRPIRLLKDSYINDTTPIPRSATAVYTTLHWAPMVVTDSAGNAAVSFYANDLPGLYFNVLQGISTQGVISSRSFFTIEKDNDE